jgi:hypothetical protein
VFRLGDLYPLPPIYHNIPRARLLAHGKAFAARMEPFAHPHIDARGMKVLKDSELGAACVSASLGSADEHATNTDAALVVMENALTSLYSQVKDLANGQYQAGLASTVQHRANSALTAAAPDSVLVDAGVNPEQDVLYPIHLAAGLLLSDGSTLLAREDIALEYGCSMDPITKLTFAMQAVEGRGATIYAGAVLNANALHTEQVQETDDGEKRQLFPAGQVSAGQTPVKHVAENRTPATGNVPRSGVQGTPAQGCSAVATVLTPTLKTATRFDGSRATVGTELSHSQGVTVLAILQVDQFGVCHAPQARARSWLHENGYGHVAVYAHNKKGQLMRLHGRDLCRVRAESPVACTDAGSCVSPLFSASPISLARAPKHLTVAAAPSQAGAVTNVSGALEGDMPSLPQPTLVRSLIDACVGIYR